MLKHRKWVTTTAMRGRLAPDWLNHGFHHGLQAGHIPPGMMPFTGRIRDDASTCKVLPRSLVLLLCRVTPEGSEWGP